MIKPFKIALVVMLVNAIFWAANVSLIPYVIKIILNRVTENADMTHLIMPLTAYIVLHFGVTTLFRCYDYFVTIKMIPQMRTSIATSAFHTLLGQTHTFYQNNFAGSLINKINDLVMRVPDVLQIVIDRFFSHGLALAIAAYALSQVHIAFALMMLLWAALFIIGSALFAPYVVRLANDWAGKGSTVTGQMVDVLSNALSMRLFARRHAETQSLEITANHATDAEQKLQCAYWWMWIIFGYSFAILQIFNLYFLIQGRQRGVISVGDFALVLTLNAAIVDFMWHLTKDFADFTRAWGRITQAICTIAYPIDIQDKPHVTSLRIKRGEIVFDDVLFHYNSTVGLFENTSVTIQPGQKVGLVGYSGSGKSTFVNLILRLYDVTSGRILIDDQDIKDVTQDSLHETIAMIPQEPSLFHRSLMDNIRYGKTDATDEEVVAATRKAYAHDFIMTLPQGYESLVGERGVKLSGGQRQRIAIARAILKNAPILMLDEATSHLDSVTEAQIQDSLWDLMQGKTTVVVAHRLSTLLHMDIIMVFDKGKIVEQGTHAELLAQENGLYRTLWHAQVGGFLPDKKLVLDHVLAHNAQ